MPDPTGTRFIVVQLIPHAHPGDIEKPNHLSDYGVLVPTAADGFYQKQADAVEVAEYMAEERPDLSIYIAEVVWAKKAGGSE